MKKIIITIFTVLLMGSGVVQAAIYNIGPGDDFGFFHLVGNDSLVMTGGESDWLVLDDLSVATIENTEPITDTETGGIWMVDMRDYSTLNLEGGEINFIEAGWESTVNMTGGYLDYIKVSGESTVNMTGGYLDYIIASGESKAYLRGGTIDDFWRMPLEDGEPIEEAMIHVFALDYLYDSPSNLLTGHWGDNSAFSINLNIPSSDYIEFHIIPEPTSILLLGLGGLMLRRRV